MIFERQITTQDEDGYINLNVGAESPFKDCSNIIIESEVLSVGEYSTTYRLRLAPKEVYLELIKMKSNSFIENEKKRLGI